MIFLSDGGGIGRSARLVSSIGGGLVGTTGAGGERINGGEHIGYSRLSCLEGSLRLPWASHVPFCRFDAIDPVTKLIALLDMPS